MVLDIWFILFVILMFVLWVYLAYDIGHENGVKKGVARKRDTTRKKQHD